MNERLDAASLRPLDTGSRISRYLQIADQLAGLIMDQQPGVRLPSEHEIVARLGVSRATAVQALRELEQRGLVTRQQGKGTFIAHPERAIRSNAAGQLPSFSEDLRAAGRQTSERVLTLEVTAAAPDVAGALGLAPGTDVWKVTRLIVSDGQPVVHLTSWLPRDLVPALTRSGIESTSLYEQLLLTAPQSRPQSADESWCATVAPPATAALLEVSRNAPVMRVLRTAYRADERVVEYAVSHVRGETFEVSIHVAALDESARPIRQLREPQS